LSQSGDAIHGNVDAAYFYQRDHRFKSPTKISPQSILESGASPIVIALKHVARLIDAICPTIRPV
jgi:hypothetical protein